MRVLLAAKYVPTGPRPIGGVQSWVQTVRNELHNLGHEVIEWQPEMPMPSGRFDLGIFANLGLTDGATHLCDKVVSVTHGIIETEKPKLGLVTLCVSEGVRAHWGGSGAILRQPIDLTFWRDPGARRSGIVRYSYRNTPTICEQVAATFGMPYRQVFNATHPEARVALSTAALVFATGRAALEAMACGAPTVIYDHRQTYQGPLLDDDLHRQMHNSYSGRGGINPNLNDLVDASNRAMELGSRRTWVQKHHDVRDIVQQLLA